MKLPPEGGMRDANGMIASMTSREQADWITWRDSLDPNDPADEPYIAIMALSEDLYDVLKRMEANGWAWKLQNDGAQ